MKTFWNPLPYDVRIKPFNFGDGVNVGLPVFDIKDSELTDAENVDSREYPAIHVRPPRSTYATITTPRMIGQRNNQYLLVVDGTKWQYYNGSAFADLADALTAANAKVIDFATGTNLYTIFNNGTDKKYWDGSGVFNLTAMPGTTKFTPHRGRIYAAVGKEIQYCALNLITDWTTAGDAGKISVTNAKGDLTAITTYADHVVAWSEYSMHELYGTGPKNYSLVDVSREIGCVSDRSVKEVGGKLYWLDRNNNGQGYVYQYAGGTLPVPVSFKVQKYIDRINWAYANTSCAGTDGRRYYLSVPLDSATSPNKLLVFDTFTENWYLENGNFVGFTEMAGVLYGMQSDGVIKNMNATSGETVSWYIISKPFNENNLAEKKSLHRLYFIVDLPAGSTLTCSLSDKAEGSEFTDVKTFTANTDLQNVRIDVPLTIAQKTDWYRIKLSGTGPCTIYSGEKHIRIARRG